MYKVLCTQANCENKDIIYYLPTATNPTMCGGCKLEIKPKKMTETEFKQVFDYDPLTVSDIV